MQQRSRDCHFYVQRGWCRYGARCRFHHPSWVQPKDPPSSPQGGSSAARRPPEGQPASPLTHASDSRNGEQRAPRPSSGSSAGQLGGYNSLLAVARGTRSLQGSQFQMASLIQDAWDRLQEDAGNVLQLLGGPDSYGLQAVEEMCRAPCTTTAGNNPTLISFQRVTVPLLRLVTSRLFLNSPLTELSNPVLARMTDSLDLQAVAACLVQLANAGSIADPRHKPGERDGARWAPADYIQLARPVADFLYEVLLKFRDKQLRLAEGAAACVNALEALCARLSTQQGPAPDTVLARVRDVDRILHEHARRQQHQSDLERRRERQLQQASLRERLFGRQGEQQTVLDGPGELRQAGRRHSNDHQDISRISIMPTCDEVLCSAAPYLPKGPSLHLPAGSAEAHLDRQFRLLRHDIIAELCAGVAAYQAASAHTTASAMPGQQPQQPHQQQQQQQTRRLLSAAVPDVRVVDYKNVTVEAVHLNRWAGAHFLITFEDLESNQRRTPEQRREFWSKTKRLQHGTLVCLLVPPHAWAGREGGGQGAGAEGEEGEEKEEERLVFATITQRDVENKLAPRVIPPGFRPCIGISLGSGESHTNDLRCIMRLLTHSSSKGGGSRGLGVVMLQSSGSYFAYEPILKALQRMEHLPLQQYLLPPADAATITQHPAGSRPEVVPPAYLASRHVYDLSMLADAGMLEELGPSEAAALQQRLAAVNLLDPGAFPTSALAALTTLDPGQVASLKAALSQQLVLIQGPPGTGKTHLGIQLMRVLLSNLGPDELPVLCVCYTNHALDQFLEGIKAAGLISSAEEMIRIGSKSKSEVMRQHNLSEMKRGSQSKQSERRLAASCYESMGKLEEDCKGIVQRLADIRNWLPWHAARDLVHTTAPSLYSSLVGEAAEGDWQQGGGSRTSPAANWARWLHGRDLQRKPAAQNPAHPRSGPSGGPTGEGRQAGHGGDVRDASASRRQLLLQALARRGFDLLALAEADMEVEGEGAEAEVEEEQQMEEDSTDDMQLDSADEEGQAGGSGDEAELDLAGLLDATDAWALSRPQRQQLVEYWHRTLQSELLDSLHRKMELYSGCIDRLRHVHDSSNLEVLRKAKVIGATTSGVAMHQGLIASLGVKIVLCEEAAEVLEAHMLASLTRHTEQLILIGDHEQLRPKVQTFQLSMDSKAGYNLDLSLFERLVRQGMVPVDTLSVQHRMRPEVSRLIRGTIYPGLKDHPKVLRYGSVRGMQSPVFWMTHDAPEGGDRDDLSSKFNAFEAQMATRLARYLVQKGYGRGSVTVVTPYVGQLLQLRRELSRHLCISMDERDAAELAELDDSDVAAGGREMSVRDAVRLATIDNYQDEENSIIILSLVRSNRDNQIGFVRLQNRVNVMLSRAKEGLFILGNADCLVNSRQPGIWPQVVSLLEADDMMGPAFQLVCQKHPSAITAVSEPADFDARCSDGGCSRSCLERLPCGHACPRQCHSDDPGHRLTKCMKPCNRPQACGHPCQRKCHEACGRCGVRLESVRLPCGHTMKSLECWRAQELESVRCEQLVEVVLSHCRHAVHVACSDVAKAERMPWMCTQDCGALLECEHPCSSTCGGCLQGWLCQQLGLRPPALANLATTQQGSTLTVHLPGLAARALDLPAASELTHARCRLVCGRTLFCGHSCESQCHQGAACPPCPKPCTVSCSHSACRKQCGAYCPPCAEPCTWECPHQGACPMPCGAPCVRLPCDRRCERRLPCGCQCPSVCGEPCPPTHFCPNHGSLDVTVYDPIMASERCSMELTQEELEEDPLICLPCGHALPMTGMDMHMELEACLRSAEGGREGSEVRGGYTKQEGRWAAPYPLSEDFSAGKTCMLCRAPLGQILRYGRLLNKHGVDAAERKFLQSVGLRLGRAERQLASLSQSAAAATGSASGTGGSDGAAVAVGGPSARRATLQGLQREGLQLLQACRQLVKDSASPPTDQVYHAARATVLRLAGESQLPQSEADELLRQLVMPHPDITPSLRALTLRTQCCMELMQLYVSELSLCIDERLRLPGHGRGAGAAMSQLQPGSRAAQLTSRLIKLYGQQASVFRSGQAGAQIALAQAEDRGMPLFQISVHRTLAQLLMARALSLTALDSAAVTTAVGQQPAAHHTALQQERGQVLDAAGTGLQAALRLLQEVNPGARGSLQEELEGLEHRLGQLRHMGELTEAERDEILAALIEKEPSLADTGWTGTGHFNRCDCGVTYVIGDCGGANQVATCPGCGRSIGGSGHRLAEGSTPADDLFQRAQLLQSRR